MRLVSGGYGVVYGGKDAVRARKSESARRNIAARDKLIESAPVAGATEVTVTTNAAWADARPVLSVLTPFLRDDPSGLLAAIQAQAARLSTPIEIVALDDGTGDDALAARLVATIQALTIPASFVHLSQNEGRSAARNRLAQFARGRLYGGSL